VKTISGIKRAGSFYRRLFSCEGPGRPSSFNGLERLETRTLLAADLTGAWIGLDALSPLFSGQAIPAITLRVQNNSVDTASAAGAVVDIYLSRDNTLDLETDTKVATAKLGALKPGAIKDLILNKKINLSPGLDAGDIFLLARIDSTDKVAEDDESNNTVATDGITITQPDYDLGGTMGVPKLNLSLVQGIANKGTVQLTLANGGTANIPSTAKVDIGFFLRPVANGDNDASGDIPIATLNNQSVAIAAGKTKPYTGKLILDASILSGEYRIVAVFDISDALAETNESNNTVIGTEVFTLAPAFADLGITGGAITAPALIPAGAKAVVSITVFNAGNVAATGTVGVALVAKAQGHPNVPLVNIPSIPFTAKAGFTKTVKAVFTVPLLLINGVLYNVEVTLTPVTAAGGDDPTNNVAIVGSGFTPSIPVVLIPAIGDKVTFSAETPGNGDGLNNRDVKNGNFIDGNGRTGTYTYIFDRNSVFATLRLSWSDGLTSSITYTLLYGNEGGPRSLNGKKLKVYANENSEAIGTIGLGFQSTLAFVSF